MIYTQFAERIRQQIRERMNSLTDDVALGGCNSYEMYQAAVGEIRGLAWAERFLLDTVEQLQGADDEHKH